MKVKYKTRVIATVILHQSKVRSTVVKKVVERLNSVKHHKSFRLQNIYSPRFVNCLLGKLIQSFSPLFAFINDDSENQLIESQVAN